jgi:phosphate transport system protein
MSLHLHRDLEILKKDILTMGAMVETAVRKSVRALHERRLTLAQEVIDGDERIDQWELDVEGQCLKILALHQPVAEDLRFIAAVIKMNNNLERMGDLAVNIAEQALFLANEPPLPVPATLTTMSNAAMEMVRQSLDAFVNRDPTSARAVCARDDEVDQYNREIILELEWQMKAEPNTIGARMRLFSAARQLERIADQATNVAEEVVYLVEGEIIRHQSEKWPSEN